MRRLRILEAYREVAALGSVTAAARALGVSQPTVSRMIRELERELGQTLFQRAGQRLVLTPQGMALRDDVDRALGGLSEMWDRARDLGREIAPPLRVSAVSALAFGLLPLAWGRARSEAEAEVGGLAAPVADAGPGAGKGAPGRAAPGAALGAGPDPETHRRSPAGETRDGAGNALGVAAGNGIGRLAIRVETPDQVQADVVSGTARLGATSAPLLHRDLSLEWLGTVPCVLAVPQDDPLALSGGPVPLSALASRAMVGFSMRRGLPARIRAALRRAGVDPQTVIRTNSTMNALSFVRAGAGVAVVEPLTPAGMPVAGVRLLPLAETVPYCFGVVALHGIAGDERGAALIAGLLAAARTLPDFAPVAACDHTAFLASLAQEEGV